MRPDKLGNPTAVTLWCEEVEAFIKKEMAEGLAQFDLEFVKVAEGKKNSLKALREDRAIALFQDSGAGLVRVAVDFGPDDKHDLLRLWRGKAEALTAALPPGPALAAGEEYEPTRALAPRLAKFLVTALYEFLCQTVRAESADMALKRGEQERLNQIIKDGISNGKVEDVKGTTAKFLSAKCALFGQKAAVTMLDDLQEAMSTDLWSGMPGFSQMEEEVRKLAVADGELQVKATQAALIETLARWAGDAARKIPAAKPKQAAAPAIPSAQPMAKAVVLRCDTQQQLYPKFTGCGDCGSMYHKRASQTRAWERWWRWRRRQWRQQQQRWRWRQEGTRRHRAPLLELRQARPQDASLHRGDVHELWPDRTLGRQVHERW